MIRCMKMLFGSLLLAVAMPLLAQETTISKTAGPTEKDFAQIVALDECDPATFNAALGPDLSEGLSLFLGVGSNPGRTRDDPSLIVGASLVNLVQCFHQPLSHRPRATFAWTVTARP